MLTYQYSVEAIHERHSWRLKIEFWCIIQRRKKCAKSKKIHKNTDHFLNVHLMRKDQCGGKKKYCNDPINYGLN